MGFSDGLQGAGGGALAGGSVGGPLGAAIGGGLGLLGGLFGGNGEDEQTAEARRRLMMMSGMQMNPGQAGMSDLRGQQLSQLDRLTALAEGRGPSMAAQQMQDAMERAQASQQAMAGSAVGRGVGPGAAYRNAAGTVGAMHQQAARDTSMARAAEQLGALQQLTGAIGGARGQDESLGMFNVGQSNDMQMRNRLMQLQALQMAGGMNASSGPSFGEQILAGGANAYSMLGGRNQQQGQAPGQG